ncbi:MAG: hypothetical protein K8S56_10725 [Candidatus Cloacimonetes bacterium]|nr:hypothetical protein [Candidatus Cloacimonadota bacterium]
MRKIVLLIAMLALVSFLVAEQVSVRRAVFLSALMPGAGEFYAKEYNKAAMFFGAELLLYFSYFRLQQELDWSVEGYKDYAAQYAGIEAKDFSDEFYQQIQDWESSEIYNDGVIRDARNYYLIYNNDKDGYEEYLDNFLYTGDKSWNWDCESHWHKYHNLRQHKQDMEIYSKFVFGAALVTRIISVIDAARSARGYNRAERELGNIKIIPELSKKGLTLIYEYKF